MKLVCISDSHCRHRKLVMPKGDVLIHAGDFCSVGRSLGEIEKFGEWMREQPYRHKIVIAGNHDRMFEDYPEAAREALGVASGMDKLGGGLIYLQDSSVEIDGVKIYGSPWQPAFCNWAFNVPRGMKLKAKWDLIPGDTDVLITHGPPKGILDECPAWGGGYTNVGCRELGKTIMHRLNIRVHIFGHIHESYGETDMEGVHYINASSCDVDYRPVNPPIVYELPTEKESIDG